MQLLGIEMSLSEFDNFICEQNTGKELKVENGKIVAINHIETQEEKDSKEVFALSNWFETYFEKQLIQSMWQTNFKISKDIYFKDENNEYKTYNTLDELKQQAELVRQQLKILKNK